MKEIRQELIPLQDERYREFSSSLIPGSKPLLGVRIPVLRKLAKKIVKQEDWISFLEEGAEDYFEEMTVKAFVIGYADADIETVLEQAKQFIPKITDWSVNDSFCSAFRIAKKHRQRVWEFLMGYVDSKREFELRVVAVMLMDYYLTEEYIDRVLEVYNRILPVGYYTQMGVAWGIATAYAKFPEKTMGFLQDNRLDDFTYNKAITKMLESYRVADEDKDILRGMKRISKKIGRQESKNRNQKQE